MTTAPGPAARQHPGWCNPRHCGDERVRGELVATYHRSEPRTWPGNESLEAEFYATNLEEFDGGSGEPTQGYLVLFGEGPMSVAQLRSLSARLAQWADELKAMSDR